jgi:hypothetical protein
VGFWLTVSRSGAWHISQGKYPFPHEQRGKSGTTADYLAVFRSSHRRKPRISAEDKISLADNLRQNSKSSQEGPKAAVCEGAAGNAPGAALRSHEPRHPGFRTLAPEIR